jgi:hypothetical protein
MSTSTLRPWRVTVELPHPEGDGGLVPPDALVLAEAAAAGVSAADLMCAWTSSRVLLPLTVEVPCEADTLSAGWAVARAVGGHDATVEVELAADAGDLVMPLCSAGDLPFPSPLSDRG